MISTERPFDNLSESIDKQKKYIEEIWGEISALYPSNFRGVMTVKVPSKKLTALNLVSPITAQQIEEKAKRKKQKKGHDFDPVENILTIERSTEARLPFKTHLSRHCYAV